MPLSHTPAVGPRTGLLAEVTSLAMGPGALLLLARAFMTRGSWARLLAAYRLPRAVLYVAAKAAVAAARGRLRVLDAAFLRGPGHALLEGVLMPLCCPVSGGVLVVGCAVGHGVRYEERPMTHALLEGGAHAAVLPGGWLHMCAAHAKHAIEVVTGCRRVFSKRGCQRLR